MGWHPEVTGGVDGLHAQPDRFVVVQSDDLIAPSDAQRARPTCDFVMRATVGAPH
jgi:hypothetical protein